MSTIADLLDQIPEPEKIRARLSQLIREANLLRSLLRVSERKKRDGQRVMDWREVQHVAT